MILACGASNPRDIQAEGRDAEGIYFAVDYLSRTTKSLLDSNLLQMEIISLQRISMSLSSEAVILEMTA